LSEPLTPSRAASRLTHQLNLFAEVHGAARFPVDVSAVAYEAANLFQWVDPIVEVTAAALDSFEGALFDNGKRTGWMLLYNDQMSSRGRIRFTQAHELGHYVLHRSQRSAFECSKDDMFKWSDDQAIEGEANQFAANLLMPLDDFRQQVDGQAVSLEMLGQSASRYGVSLTAATLRWLAHTDESALAIASRDGYMLWSVPSKRALRHGAYFKTRNAGAVEVPTGTLTADLSIAHDKQGIPVGSRVWFPKSGEDFAIREMKLGSEHYDMTLTLLHLPRSAKAWAPFEGRD
jgi:hypothetical protein